MPRRGTRTSGSVWIPATLSRPVSTWRVWSTMCVALRVGSTWCTLMILRALSGRGGIATPTWGEGQCEADTLVDVIRAAEAPVVVETPGEAEGQARDIAWLRERL